MRKTRYIACICFLPILLFGCTKPFSEKEDVEFPYRAISNGYYFEYHDYDSFDLFYCASGDLENAPHKYIEKDKYIIKCAAQEDCIVYHLNELADHSSENDELYGARLINDSRDYAIVRDLFVVYDKASGRKTAFESQDAFLAYCQKKSITGFDWKFSNGIAYHTTETIGDWSVIQSESISLPGQILFENKVVLEGFISDLTVTDGQYLRFRLEVPQSGKLEFPTESNKMLRIGSAPVGKHRVGLLFLYDDIYYDKTITVDTKTNQVQAYD